MNIPKEYWKNHSLKDLNTEQWEALCDGCGRCCLQKLINEETKEVFYTSLACRLLDIDSCRCTDYTNRCSVEPACMNLRENLEKNLPYLPNSCAYRRIWEGKDLPTWHPLQTKTSSSVHDEGISVQHYVVDEKDLSGSESLEDYILDLS